MSLIRALYCAILLIAHLVNYINIIPHSANQNCIFLSHRNTNTLHRLLSVTSSDSIILYERMHSIHLHYVLSHQLTPLARVPRLATCIWVTDACIRTELLLISRIHIINITYCFSSSLFYCYQPPPPARAPLATHVRTTGAARWSRATASRVRMVRHASTTGATAHQATTEPTAQVRKEKYK